MTCAVKTFFQQLFMLKMLSNFRDMNLIVKYESASATTTTIAPKMSKYSPDLLMSTFSSGVETS